MLQTFIAVVRGTRKCVVLWVAVKLINYKMKDESIEHSEVNIVSSTDAFVERIRRNKRVSDLLTNLFI